MIVVKLDEVHARGCQCDGQRWVDEECAILRGLIAEGEEAGAEVYVQAVRPSA